MLDFPWLSEPWVKDHCCLAKYKLNFLCTFNENNIFESNMIKIHRCMEILLWVCASWGSTICLNASYRLLGGACWQWCSWRHWRRHTPTPRGPPCWEIWTVSCLSVGRCACFCWASLPSPIKENSSSKCVSWVDNDTGSYLRMRLTFLHVMLGNGSPSASQGMTSSRPASCLYSPPGTTRNLGGSYPTPNTMLYWCKYIIL